MRVFNPENFKDRYGRTAKFDITNEKHRRMLYGATQHFMQAPIKDAETRNAMRVAMQNFTTPGDFPASILPVLKTFQTTDYFDNAWETCFDVMDHSSSGRSGFVMHDISGGLTFSTVPLGGKAKVYGFAGTSTQVNYELVGGGIGWPQQLFDDAEWYTIDKNAVEFRNKWYKTRADAGYAIIDAMGSGIDVTWQAPVPSGLAATDPNYAAVRDIETINKACVDILTACKDKGYGLSPSSPFVLLAPIQLRSRITRALSFPLNSNVSGGFNGVQWNISPQYTMGLTATNKYYICIPKQKNVFADRKYLEIMEEKSITDYSNIAVGWGRYGGAICDTDQWKRCAIS